MDAGPPILCPNACINVTVLVQDACDHNPVFDDLPREVNISESTVVGAQVSYITEKTVSSHYIIMTGYYCDCFRSRFGYKWSDTVFYYKWKHKWFLCYWRYNELINCFSNNTWC